MRPPVLHPEDIDRIGELRARDLTYDAIAERIERSRSCVQYHCLENGFETSRPPRATPRSPGVYYRNGLLVRPFDDEEDAAVLRLAGEGKGHAEIGRRLRRKGNVIRARLNTLARREERALWNSDRQWDTAA